MNSAAITGHAVTFGVIDFYCVAREADINPIIVCEVCVAAASRFDRESEQPTFDKSDEILWLGNVKISEIRQLNRQ